MRIRVTTRADLYEQRKREHINRGYRIEDERPSPVNGFSLVHRRTGAICFRPICGRCSGGPQQLPRRARGLVRCSMSLEIRFRFEGRCTRHPRYDQKRDGRPSKGTCDGCESLYVIHLYTKIAKRRSEDRNLSVARVAMDREEHRSNDEQHGSENGEES